MNRRPGRNRWRALWGWTIPEDGVDYLALSGTSAYSFTGEDSAQNCTGHVRVPATYNPDNATEYPIYMALHGLGGNSATTVANFLPAFEAAVAAGQCQDGIVIMPTGGANFFRNTLDATDLGATKLLDVLSYYRAGTRWNGQTVGTGFSMGCWAITVMAMENIGEFDCIWGVGGPNMDGNPVSGNANNWRYVNSTFSTPGGGGDVAVVNAVWGPTDTAPHQATTLAALTAQSPLATATGGALANLHTAAIIAGLPMMYCMSTADSVSSTSLVAMTAGYAALAIPHIFCDLTTPAHNQGQFYDAAQAASTVGTGNGFKWVGQILAGTADVTAPTVSSIAADTDGLSITINTSEALSSHAVPATSALTTHGTHAAASVVTVRGSAVKFTFATAIRVTDFETVTLDYTQPGSNKLQDPAGNLLASFSGTAVTNNSTFLNGALIHVDLAHPAGAATQSLASVSQGSDISNAAWTKTQMTTTSATTATVNVGATTPTIGQTITNHGVDATSQVDTAVSLKAKFVDITWLLVEMRAGTATDRVWFNISAGTVGTTGTDLSGAAISAADGSGYRTITFNFNKSGGTGVLNLRPVTADNVLTSPASGTTLDVKEMTVTQVKCSSVPNMVDATTWVNATAAQQPAYQATSGPNSKPRILGSMIAAVASTAARRLYNTAAASYDAFDGSDAAYTLFMVVSGHGDATSALFGVGNSGVAAADSNYWGTINTGNGRFTTSKHDGVAVTASSSADHGGTAAVSEWFSTGIAVSHLLNGAAANPSAAAQDTASIAPNRSTLLGRGTSGELQGQGGLSAVIAFPSNKSAGDRSDVRAYLGAIYGITVA